MFEFNEPKENTKLSKFQQNIKKNKNESAKFESEENLQDFKIETLPMLNKKEQPRINQRLSKAHELQK